MPDREGHESIAGSLIN
jgi:hypothetical protein